MMFLDTILGRVAVLVACIAIALLAGYWRGHHRGWDRAVAHDKAVVAACMAANARQAATVDDLQRANAAYAQAAAVSKAEQEHAEAAVAAQAAASAAALKAGEKRLDNVLRGNTSVAAWANEPVPAAVTDSLRQ